MRTLLCIIMVFPAWLGLCSYSINYARLTAENMAVKEKLISCPKTIEKSEITNKRGNLEGLPVVNGRIVSGNKHSNETIKEMEDFAGVTDLKRTLSERASSCISWQSIKNPDCKYMIDRFDK